MTHENNKGKNMLYYNLTWDEIEEIDKAKTVLIQPIGAIEQHGLHLGLGQDSVCGYELCKLSSDAVVDTYVLPPVWWGSSTALKNFPGTISLKPSTLILMLKDIIKSLERYQWQKLVFFNTHGGNPGILNSAFREVKEEGSAMSFFNYFWIDDIADQVKEIIDADLWGHACEFETSLALQHFPDGVQLDKAQENPFKAELREAVSDWKSWNKNGNHGDPRKSTLEKGKLFTKLVVDNFSKYLQAVQQY